MNNLGKQLAEAWLDAYVKVSRTNESDALADIFICGQVLGPPGSNLRKAAMAYVGYVDQEWSKGKNNELASN